MGVCYFWPTMLGFVSENLPRTGAVGLNLMGGAGMLAVSLYTIIMGGYYDKLIVAKLNTNIPIGAYSAPSATPDMISALTEAKKAAGPQIINATLIIPIILTAAFIGLFIYIRSRKKVSTQQPAPINVESYQL
jgi:hypothetical protein